MITLNIDQIKEAIPQREPMLLVDKIMELEPRKRVVGFKEVKTDEPFFKGHFPGEPIMPGVFIIELMAQVSTFLFYDPDKKDKRLIFLLGAVKEARFFKPVLPKSELIVTSEPLRLAENTGDIKSRVTSEGEKIAECELIVVRKKT